MSSDCSRSKELEKMRHGDKFDYSIEVGAGLDTYETEIPPLMVQPIVENAIIHAFSKKQHKGFLKILFTIKDNHFFAIVEDNGIGFNASKARKKVTDKSHKSLGISIIFPFQHKTGLFLLH